MFFKSSSSKGVALLALVRLATSTQVPFTSLNYHNSLGDNELAKPVITEEFSAEVLQILEKSGVQGTTVAVVRPDGDVELGAFGNRSESGDPTKPSARQDRSS